jgi:hypothetical protein
VIDEYKQQADQYVMDQIAHKQAELQQAFENEVQKEAQKRSVNPSEQSFEFEMDGVVQIDEKLNNGIAGNLERSQIRRRNAKQGKINTIGNSSQMSDSDVLSQFSAMEIQK